MLRNIRFKDVKVDIRGIGSISRVLIRWELEPTTQRLNNLFFYIDRGEAETEMKPVNASPIPASVKGEYMDYTPLMKDLSKNYYYRVRAVELNPCNQQPIQTIYSALVEWENPPDLVAQYVIDEHLYAHRYVYGNPALIYTKRKEGTRCDCYDEVLKRVTKSNCTSCFGVGFIGGYYPPIEAWMDFAPSPEVVTIADFGVKQAQQTDIQFTDYPNIQVGDLILQVKPFNLWRVENIRSTMKNQVTILQICRLNMVNRSDIEYSIGMPQATIDKMLKELRDRELTPEF